jgi:hypothetical protein
MEKPKKIILIVVDSLRADHLGCYGYQRNTSPNIDKIAEENILFKWAFSTISYTIPSFTSILTSLYPSNHSIGFHHKFPKFDKDKDILLSEILRSSDYTTAAFVSSIVLRKEIGLNTGFDIYDAPENIRSAENTNEKFFSWLDENYNKDLFAMIHYFDVHLPYRPPTPYDKVFVEDEYYGNPKYLDISLDGWGSEGEIPQIGGIPKSAVLSRNDKTENDARYYISQYDGCIRYIDFAISEIIEKLKKLTIYKDFLIIITADHGDSMGENNVWFYHALTVTPDLIHVPLIIKFPDNGVNKIIDTHVSHLDIMPTVLELIGYDLNDLSLQGKSLLKLITSGSDYTLEERIINAEIQGQIAYVDKNKINVIPKEIDKNNIILFHIEELCNKKITYEYRKNKKESNDSGLKVTYNKFKKFHMSFNPLNYPACFEKPRRLTDITSWHEHIPFAFTIVQMLKPKVIVELGTHKGDSYCAFCQVVDTLRLDTKCYAIDAWEGDEQAGFYSADILKELRTYHDPLYGRFSRLIQSPFDEALDHFSDSSIDLLHIDGLHTYEAVKNDFEKWLPKMSAKGVILFHDTNVHENDFGVWRLCEELKDKYPNFEFKYGHGLDVFSVGAKVPEELSSFLKVSERDKVIFSKFYYHIGNEITLANTLQARDARINELTKVLQSRDNQIIELYNTIRIRDIQIEELKGILQEINQSITWQMVLKFQNVIEKTFPSGTKRRKWYDLGIKRIRTISNKGQK